MNSAAVKRTTIKEYPTRAGAVKRVLCFSRYPLMAFLASRIALFLAVYLGLALAPVSAQGVWRHFPDNLFLDGFSRFDSGWYLGIALNGYTNLPNLEGQRDTAFFPGFPGLLALVGRLFSLSDAQGLGVAGIIICNLCFLLSLCLLYNLAHRYFGKAVARLSVAMMAFGLFSIFFSAVYTESLFLFAALASFWLSARGKLYPAMACAALAASVRVVGFLVTPFALLLCAIESPLFSSANTVLNKAKTILVAIAIGFSTPVFHLAFLGLRFGNPLQFIDSQNADNWGKAASLDNLFQSFAPVFSAPNLLAAGYSVTSVVNVLALVACLAILLAALYRRTPLPWPLIAWSLLMAMTSSPLWFSAGRFVSVIFPIYILTAYFLRRLPMELVIAPLAMLMALFAFLFAHWQFVA